MRLPMAVFLILSGFYLLTMSGHTYSSDEETMLAVTRGLIERGDVAVVVEDGAPVSALRPGRDGRVYSPYGILPSLLAIPLHLLGTLIAPSGLQADYASRFTATMLNSLLTAVTCAILVQWTQRLGATDGWALMLAFLYGLATFAWTYARTFFSEPLAALLILGATERAWSAFRVNSPGAQHKTLFISGLLAGLLPATRIAAAIAIPVIGLYVLWETLKTWSTNQTKSAPHQRWQILAHILSGLIIWIAGCFPVLHLPDGTIWCALGRCLRPVTEAKRFSSLRRLPKVFSGCSSVQAKVYSCTLRRSCWLSPAVSLSGGVVNEPQSW
jgi:hypothetical protein